MAFFISPYVPLGLLISFASLSDYLEYRFLVLKFFIKLVFVLSNGMSAPAMDFITDRSFGFA